MNKLKRAVAIHDISGFGKCSLTVALPIISAAGIETVAMPTALLSTHTGGIEGYTYKDLTDEMRPIAKHWETLGLEFDAVYTGYMANKEQIDIVSDFIDSFKTENNVVAVDPAMADNGSLYSHLTADFAKKMSELCCKADIIVPNFTEASIILGEEYKKGPYDKRYVEDTVARLREKTGAMVVLTGVDFGDGMLGAVCLDEEINYAFAPKIDGYYHGTGDIFASVLVAAYLNGKTLNEATAIAVDFTCGCIKRTVEQGTDHRFGVDFERGLPELIKKLGL